MNQYKVPLIGLGVVICMSLLALALWSMVRTPSIEVYFVTQPEGAVVTVNQVVVQGEEGALLTPGTGKVKVAGRMLLRIEKKGYLPFERQVDLRGLQALSGHEIVLEPRGSAMASPTPEPTPRPTSRPPPDVVVVRPEIRPSKPRKTPVPTPQPILVTGPTVKDSQSGSEPGEETAILPPPLPPPPRPKKSALIAVRIPTENVRIDIRDSKGKHRCGTSPLSDDCAAMADGDVTVVASLPGHTPQERVIIKSDLSDGRASIVFDAMQAMRVPVTLSLSLDPAGATVEINGLEHAYQEGGRYDFETEKDVNLRVSHSGYHPYAQRFSIPELKNHMESGEIIPINLELDEELVASNKCSGDAATQLEARLNSMDIDELDQYRKTCLEERNWQMVLEVASRLVNEPGYTVVAYLDIAQAYYEKGGIDDLRLCQKAAALALKNYPKREAKWKARNLELTCTFRVYARSTDTQVLQSLPKLDDLYYSLQSELPPDDSRLPSDIVDTYNECLENLERIGPEMEQLVL